MPASNNTASRSSRQHDFTGGIRGKYAARYARGTNLIRLEHDIARVFPDAKSVNAALRSLIGKARKSRVSSLRA